MGMEPAYPADTTHNSCEDRRISRSRWAGQGRSVTWSVTWRVEGIFRLHFGYRSWDRSTQRGARSSFFFSLSLA